MLNNNNDTDRIWFSRHSLDLTTDILYGASSYEKPIAELLFTVRNRGVWGNPNNIARTTFTRLKILNTVGFDHRHSIPRHIFWMREVWLQFNLSNALDLTIGNDHTFTIGAFPFELGRGIALGSAYAVGPELLGFYSDVAIDQYAFGAKLSGEAIKNNLYYDLYGAILQNKSSDLSETAEKIRGQEFGRLATPQRGFGVINFLIAGRLIWEVFNNDKLGLLKLEPYALYNHDPEQQVEFRADAQSKLGTIGMAGEYHGDQVEFGFDWAFNLGQQRVKGFDRNQVRLENRAGAVVEVNSHVLDGQGQDAKKVLFDPGSDAQKIIDGSFRNETQNNQEIGQVDTAKLFNADNRFRNPFTNKFEGWMFVADAAYWAYKKDLQLAVSAGIASGDENPNLETKDGVFSGFLSLQELYYGKRVQSAFLLGSAGKLRIPLSAPTTNQAPSRFARVVSRFTNLVFAGVAAHWIPHDWKRKLEVNPNILAYWQEKPTNKFDAETKTRLEERASTFLGVEANVFIDYYLLDNLKVFLISSVFFAGQHFTDVKGQPLNEDQDKALDRLDRTGFSRDRIPNLGDDTAYTFNLGLEFRF